jgi:hypothetical protein
MWETTVNSISEIRRSLLAIAVATACTALSVYGAGRADAFRLVPGGSYIVPVDRAENILHQCSRATPTKITRFWSPSPHDIRLLESTLMKPAMLGVLARHGITPLAYNRQYVGIEVSGRRAIYGNFFPASLEDLKVSDDVVVCDGGPSLWGIVFDPTTERFSNIQVNGSA